MNGRAWLAFAAFSVLLWNSVQALDYTVSVSFDENTIVDPIIPENEIVSFHFDIRNNDVLLFNILQVTVRFPEGYWGRSAEPPLGWATQGLVPWSELNDLNFVALGDQEAIVAGTSKTFSVDVSIPFQDVKSVSFSSTDQNEGRSAVVFIRLFPITTPQTPESQMDSDDDGVSNYQEDLDKTDPKDVESNLYRLLIQNDSIPIDRVQRVFLFHPTIGKILDTNAEFGSPSGRRFVVSSSDDGTIVFSPSEEGAYQVTVRKKSFSRVGEFRVFSQVTIPGGTVGRTPQAPINPLGQGIPIAFTVLVAFSLFAEVFGFTISKVFFSVPESRLQRIRQLLMRTALSILLFSIPVSLGFIPTVGFQNAVGIAVLEIVLLFLIVYYKLKISGFHILYLFSRMLFREKTVHPTMESEAEQHIESMIAEREREMEAPKESERDQMMKEILSRLQKTMTESAEAKRPSTEATRSAAKAMESLWSPDPSLGDSKKSLNGVRYFESKKTLRGNENLALSLKNQLGASLNASKAVVLLDGKPFNQASIVDASTLALKLPKSALLELSMPGFVSFKEKATASKNAEWCWTIEMQSNLQVEAVDDAGNRLSQSFLSIQGEVEKRVLDVEGNFIWQTVNGMAFIPLDGQSIRSRTLSIKCIQAHFEESTESIKKESLNSEKALKKTIKMKKIR